MSKVIGIIGTRKRDTLQDLALVWEEFRRWYEPGDKICSGGCKNGGDRFAEVIANRLNLTEKNGGLILHLPKGVSRDAPKWKYVKELFARNTLVANDSDIIIACVSLDRTGGTEDTIRKYVKMGKGEVYLC